MQLFVVEDKKIRRVDGQLNHKQMQHVLVSCVCKLSQAIGGLWSPCVLLRESNFAVAILIVFVNIYVSISCTSLFWCFACYLKIKLKAFCTYLNVISPVVSQIFFSYLFNFFFKPRRRHILNTQWTKLVICVVMMMRLRPNATSETVPSVYMCVCVCVHKYI